MKCQNKITHTVQEGDTLYKLARKYRTTVTELILGNSGVNPYNLQIGMKLNVCPGEEYREPEQTPVGGIGTGKPEAGMPESPEIPGGGVGPEQTPGSGTMPETPEQQGEAVLHLIEEMRLAWLSQIYWARMYMMSVDADSADQQAVLERMMQTPDEIVDVFAPYFSTTATRQLHNLLMEHAELTGKLLRVVKAGQTAEESALTRDWYGNANQIAMLLEGQNPFFGSRETRNLLLNHLDMTREAMEYEFRGDYGRSIEVFRDIEKQTLAMADYFAQGLLAR